TEQTGQPRPGADNQRRIAFARLDDRIILGADHVVGVRVRSGPLGPSAARTLLDVVAQSAASRDLHPGHKLSAPHRFIEGVGQPIAVAVITFENFRRRIKSLQQGKNHAAVTVFIHQFVVVAGAVPASGSINVLPIRQFCVVQMTRFVPARDLKTATLNEKEVPRALGRLLQENIAVNPERNRIAARLSDFSPGVIAARFPPRREVRSPEIPTPIVVGAAINPARTRNLLLRDHFARGCPELERCGGSLRRKKIGRNHSALGPGLFVAHLIDKDAYPRLARSESEQAAIVKADRSAARRRDESHGGGVGWSDERQRETLPWLTLYRLARIHPQDLLQVICPTCQDPRRGGPRALRPGGQLVSLRPGRQG